MQSESDILLAPRHYEVLSAASIAEVRTYVLKHEDTFAVFDQHGDVTLAGNREQGVYHEGTRHLSRMEVWLGPRRPVLLSVAVRRDNTMLTAHLTNPDILDDNGRLVPHGVIHIIRSNLVWNGSVYQHIRVRNFGSDPVALPLEFVVDADYADIFEVRGKRRAQRGERHPAEFSDGKLDFSYLGLDGVLRRTSLRFAPAPIQSDESGVHHALDLQPQDSHDFHVTVSCSSDGHGRIVQMSEAIRARRSLARKLTLVSCSVTTSNDQFNAWVWRSLQDLNLLLTEVPDGHYPYAGIPWFNTFFGRDGIITALMALWVNPLIARGVLGHLAATQAAEENPESVAQPGKILHESRGGEMAALGEIPFKRYYGSVDATPLFVILAGAFLDQTGDRPFIESIWSNIERALDWIDHFGDLDGDGFVEYVADVEGLTQQGWKDSEDSVFHSDGRLASDPVALCEVQAYTYAAKFGAARMADALGRVQQGNRLRQEAIRLRQQFERAFWCEDLGMYALALDGEKRACRVRTSNAGHALFSGISRVERADRLATELFQRDLYCGWGIRTLSSRERRYNPMSYHNGSVWPHDNAIIGLGLARYGYRKQAQRLLRALFHASLYEPQQRLPELFCGFVRRKEEGPTPYPVACSPQAWSAATVFGLLQACLGLQVNGMRRRVTFDCPSLPAFLQEVRLERLRVGEAEVDIIVQRYAGSVGVEVARRDGKVEVVSRQ